MTPEELDLLAKDLHHEWESPDLWRRIESRRRQRAWAAAAVILAACLALALLLPRPAAQRAPDRAGGPLLSDDAFAEVAAAEKAYLRSIERLSRAAEGKLRGAKSPVMAAHAAKLQVLDEAIAELREEAERNTFSAHVHGQMAQLYRQKQETLEWVIRHD